MKDSKIYLMAAIPLAIAAIAWGQSIFNSPPPQNVVATTPRRYSVVCPHCGRTIVVSISDAAPVIIQSKGIDDAEHERKQQQELIDLEARRVKLEENRVRTGGTDTSPNGATIYYPAGTVPPAPSVPTQSGQRR